MRARAKREQNLSPAAEVAAEVLAEVILWLNSIPLDAIRPDDRVVVATSFRTVAKGLEIAAAKETAAAKVLRSLPPGLREDDLIVPASFGALADALETAAAKVEGRLPPALLEDGKNLPC